MSKSSLNRLALAGARKTAYLLLCVWVVGLLMMFSIQMVSAQETRANADEMLELGFLKRLFDEVGGDRTRWVEKFCDLALSLKGEEYARFVRLARLESVPLTDEERKTRPEGAQHFLGYTRSVDRPRAFQCIENDGENATADVQLDLYWLIARSPQVAPANAYKWLIKSAQRGEPRAQYRLTEELLLSGTLSGKPSQSTAPEVIEERTVERYHYWLKRAAEAGLPVAQYILGRLYAGYSRRREFAQFVNIHEGLKWLELAATQSKDDLSRDDAAARLGEIYFTGKKFPQDYKEALRWFSVVDEKRMRTCGPLAWVRSLLIQMYRDGLGVEKDQEKVEYYRSTPTVCVSKVINR